MVRVYTALWKLYFSLGCFIPFFFFFGNRLYSSLKLSPNALVLSLRTLDWTRCDCGIWSIPLTGWRGLKKAASEKVWKKLREKGNVSGFGPRESRQDSHSWSLSEILMAQKLVSIIYPNLAWLRVDKSTLQNILSRTKALQALSDWDVVIMQHLVLVKLKAITASCTQSP